MPSVQQAANWTVDKLLSFMRDINDKQKTEVAALLANRARWKQQVHDAMSITDPKARAAVQQRLMDWRHRDLANQSRFDEFAAKWNTAKHVTKQLLQAGHVTPPDYLGQLPALVPVFYIGLAVAAGAALAILANGNRTQTKGLDETQGILNDLHAGKITVDQALALMKKVKDQADSQDPFGATGILKAALPLALAVAAIILVPKFMKGRTA